MAKPVSYVRTYNLADLFDRTVKMVKGTWKTSVLAGGALVAIPSALFGIALTSMMERVARLAVNLGPNPGPVAAFRVLGAMSWIWLAAILAGALYLLAFLAVTHAVRAAVFGGKELPAESVSVALRYSLAAVIGQSLLKGLIIGAITAVPSVFLGLAVGLDGGSPALGVLAGITYIAGLVAGVWIWVSLLFAPQAVVYDKAGVLGGLRDSMRLVRGSWWRVFGFTVLVQIILSFAVGIITTPLVGVAIIPAVTDMIRESTAGTLTDAEVVEALTSFGSLGTAASIGMFVQQVLTLLIIPVFYALFFVDLKVRAGDLSSGPAEPGRAEPGPAESGPAEPGDAAPDHAQGDDSGGGDTGRHDA